MSAGVVPPRRHRHRKISADPALGTTGFAGKCCSRQRRRIADLPVVGDGITDDGRHIVTQPPGESQPERHPPKPGDQSLRDELLRHMSGGECLSLGHIDSIIQYDYPTEPPSTRQSRVITAIESLLTEGLVVVGEIVGGTEASVDPWKRSPLQVSD